jgi:RNA polymerase sigma-70 factor (ECF subfamily)
MVLGVCRRVLQAEHDAEDAFQVTFLVLVRKAESIVPRDSVGNWLYGVAYRTALKAKGRAARRKEQPLMDLPQPQRTDDSAWRELRQVLDQELNRLPDKYRSPVVLCDLQGQSHHDAARQLGWPEGTLSGRLSRARAILSRRLSRHAVPFSAAALPALLGQDAASAAVPAPLVCSTVKASLLVATGEVAAGALPVSVSALMEGVLKAMWWTKVKIATVLLLAVGIVGAGAGLLSYEALADKAVNARPADKVTAQENAADKDKKGDSKDKNDGDKDNKGDGQKNNKNDGDKNNKDDGQKNNKNDGDKNNKDDGQKNNKNDGDKNNKNDKKDDKK